MLYVFGDSFSIPQEHMNEVFGPDGKDVEFLPLEKTWTTIVNENINEGSEYVNDAVLGCANEYIYHQLVDKESLFKQGDCVIIQLTSMFREWFFEDKPYAAIHMATNITPGIDVTHEQYQAIEMYQRYLHFDKRLFIRYHAFLDSLSLRMRLYAEQGIKCLILPGFHDIPGVKGNLTETSGLEFDREKTALAYYKKTGDMRFNHFSEVNHKILADKIIEFFNTGRFIDLKTGFQTGIYTKDDI